MRKQLIQVVKNGESLFAVDGESVSTHFSHIIVQGNYDDSVKFTLNGVQMILPGGSQLPMSVQSLSVDQVYNNSTLAPTDLGIIVFGFEQSNRIFNN